MSEPRWDAARVALAKLGAQIQQNPEADPETLRGGVPDYDQIPQPVRDQLRRLTADQRQALMETLDVLVQNHFYFEDPSGQEEFL